MNSKPVFYCVGASHKSASVEFREAMFLAEDQLRLVMKQVMERHAFKEILILSTCNRFELYGFSTEAPKSQEDMLAAWLDLQSSSGKKVLADKVILKNTYFYLGRQATEHIFSVAASLDSLVIGETQITGQFKSAVSLAGELETLGPFLDRLSQEMLAVAKKVRTKTKIGEKKVSISHAAIDLARRVFRDLSEHNFLVIGAGEMAKVAAKYACTYGPGQINVVNRTRRKAENLVHMLGTGKAYDWESLKECLIVSDIVISSTGSMEPVITRKLLKQVMKARKGRTLFMVDIAIPRDIEPSCGNLDDVYLFEVDDLEKVVEGNLAERRKAADEARVYIQKGAAQFLQWLAGAAVKPTLASFRDYLDDLIGREFEKTLGRSLFDDLSEQQRQALHSLMKSVGAKILGDAARAVNQPDEDAIREQLASAIRIMFSGKVQETKTNDDENRDKDSCSSQIIRL